MSQGLLGQLRTPDSGNALVPGAVWAADNGCFNARTFTVLRWGRWLLKQPRTALWAAVPDVVADHEATMRSWRRYAPWVRRIGFRPAFVAQNGCTPNAIPADAECVFIGGDTRWKLSPEAFAVAAEARRRGLHVHVGRINSRRRFRMWAPHADTCDGTYLAFGPDTNLPKLLDWTAKSDLQPCLWGG
jgi:hypothetical protein